MRKRTDIHSPSVICPIDYQWVGFISLKPSMIGCGECDWLISERERIHAHFARTGGDWSRHEHGGSCAVCGNTLAQTLIVFYHAKTNSYIRVGEDCADKMEMDFSHLGFSAFKTGMLEWYELQAGKKKAKGLLVELELTECFEIYESGIKPDSPKPAYIVYDMVSKVVKYGNSLSEKQIAFLRKLLDDIKNAGKIAAERIKEKEAAQPVPVTDERIEIEGVVVSMKIDETPFGLIEKMLLKTVAGWCAYGTAPTGNYGKGDVITIKARVTVSNNDNKFGFLNRPKLLKGGSNV